MSKIPSTKVLAPFQRKLAELGFRRTFVSRSIYNGVSQIYRKEIPETGVALELQFWVHFSFDSKLPPNSGAISDCRISHFHSDSSGPYAVMDSRPSGFSTVEGMIKAIEFESTRTARGVGKKFQKDFK